jgi:hypothetical protein
MVLVAACIGLLCAKPAISTAEDLSGFSVVLQRGDGGDAVAIAPNHEWFLTANAVSIELWDMKTGAILRKLQPRHWGWMTRVAISGDGSAIFVRKSNAVQEVEGWKAETGTPIDRAEALAPRPDAPNWNWIEREWLMPKDALFLADVAQKYLRDQHVGHLVDLSHVVSVWPTNQRNVIQVTVNKQDGNVEEAYAQHHYYFVDLVQRKIVADVAGSTLHTSCGGLQGAFAFDGRNLVVSLTQLEASKEYTAALVVDTRPNPPALKWSHDCQNYMFSGMKMKRGLIVAAADPGEATIWDPANAHRLAHLDIHDSGVLTWSRDLTTFATGFHEIRTRQEGHKFGISVFQSGRSLLIPADREILEIRLGSNGSTVFARTETGWSAWNASSGEKLSSFELPPSDEDVNALVNGAVSSPDGKYQIVNRHDLIEVASGRKLVSFEHPLHFTDGARYVWSGSLTVWEAASGQRLWTADANEIYSKDFIVMQFPDGRVRLSEGAESKLRLVRGFEVRPFNDAAKRQFVHP